MINARMKPAKRKHVTNYSYSIRFYFTSAKIMPPALIKKEDLGQVETKEASDPQVHLVCLGDSRGSLHMMRLNLV